MTKDIPLLMPNQMSAFNADTFIEEEFLKLRDRFNLTTAVELGTCLGSTALWLAKNFQTTYTIEINEKLAAIAKERFEEENSSAILFVGNTINVLPQIIHQIKNDSIIWVDSHWYNVCPMQEELKIIADAGIKPVIAIHDFLVPGESALGYDSIDGQPFEFSWIEPALNKIYGINNFSYYYNSNEKSTDIKRGIIFIYPNND